MAGFGRTLTSLALVTALAGSPALLSACLVACLPAEAGAAVPSVSHDAVSTAAHAHHGSADASTAVSTLATAGPHETARLDGECHDCCASAADALDAGMAGERPAAVTVATTHGAALRHPSYSAFSPNRRSPPSVPPPAPVRAPLVLRI